MEAKDHAPGSKLAKHSVFGQFRTQGMVGMIYVGYHQTLLYTKYILSCGAYGYGIIDF